MNGRVWILMTEHWDDDNCEFHFYNRAVFLNEQDLIAFLNEHKPNEYAGCDNDDPCFAVDIMGIGDVDALYDASDELQAAIDKSNES